MLVRQKRMKIANIVATVTLNAPLDLEFVYQHLPNTARSGKSPWIKMRLPPDNTYIAFYKSGKYLITAKDPEKIQEIAQQILTLLHEIDLDVEIVKIEIHNVVVQATIQLPTSLESLIANLDRQKASFEPEQFPALIYKDWGVSFLIFSTGKVIITGLKDFKDAETVLERFNEVINAR